MNKNKRFSDICTQGKIVEKMEELKKNDFFRRNFCSDKELYSTGNISDIFACERKVVLRRLNSEQHPSMLNGTNAYSEQKHQEYVKEKWFSIFKESPKIKLIEKNVLVVDKNISLHGYLDCAIKIGEVIIATNIRPLNTKDFVSIKQGASRKDIIHTLLCMCLTETTHGLIIYENNDTQENEFFEIKPDKLIVKSMFNEVEKINQLVKTQTIPPIPYKEISTECKGCFFKKRCWEK